MPKVGSSNEIRLIDYIRNPKKVAKESFEQKKYFALWNENEEFKKSLHANKILNTVENICYQIFQDGFETGITQSRARESILPKDFRFSSEIYTETLCVMNDLINYKEDIKDIENLGHIRHTMTSASQHIELMTEQNAVLRRKIYDVKEYIKTLENNEDDLSEDMKNVLEILEGEK